jgi:SAM-dependent methyltransferase
MELVDLYNDAYEPYINAQISLDLRDRVERESLGFLQLVDEIKNRFMPEQPWEELKVLVMGAGLSGLALHLGRRHCQLSILDFSPKALELTRQLAQLAHIDLQSICLDVTHPDAKLPEKYDLIIDSHLMHCLAFTPGRASYLSLIRDHLAPAGYFVGETMVHRKKLYIPSGYRLDEDNILWQKFSDWVPVRKIIDSLDLEQEFQKAQLHIHYFYYYGNYSIAPSQDFWEIPSDILPASVRFALSLKPRTISD